MELDLSALDRLAHASGQNTAPGCKDMPGDESRPQGNILPFTGKHYNGLEAEREAAKRMAAAYREYQDNIRRSEQLRAEITKGILAGVDPYRLLLQAMEAISRMTNDRLFYDQGRESLRAIYGPLGYSEAVADSMEDVGRRLERLREALDNEKTSSGYSSIYRAIREHEARIDQLAAMATKCDK